MLYLQMCFLLCLRSDICRHEIISHRPFCIRLHIDPIDTTRLTVNSVHDYPAQGEASPTYMSASKPAMPAPPASSHTVSRTWRDRIWHQIRRYNDFIFLGFIILGFVLMGMWVMRDPPLTSNDSQTNYQMREVPLGEFVVAPYGREVLHEMIQPIFTPVRQVSPGAMPATAPVIALVVGDDQRAYPLHILSHYAVVNDRVGALPVAITYCPMCNSAVVYDRRVQDSELTFSVSGTIRNSGFVLWDDMTQSWWQQFTGRAVVGYYTGTNLRVIPTQVISYEKFARHYPNGQVLTGDAASPAQSYDNTLWQQYETRRLPRYFSGQADRRLPAMERVLSTTLGGISVAYPYSVMREQRVINHQISGEPVMAMWMPGASSVLDERSIAGSMDVGMAALYSRRLDGQILVFYREGGQFFDYETGSQWNIFGEATAGTLSGKRLQPVIARSNFWFAWSTAYPDTQVYTPSDTAAQQGAAD